MIKQNDFIIPNLVEKKFCNECNKPINKFYIDMLKCKCNNIFCSLHLHNHKCSFNYRENHKISIREKLPPLTHNKVIKII